jgi:hypothetical protein
MILIRAAAKNPSLSPSSLSPRTILILSITLSLIGLLVIVMGAVHCILKRHRRKMEEQRNARQWPHQPLPTPQAPRIFVTDTTPMESLPNNAPTSHALDQPPYQQIHHALYSQPPETPRISNVREPSPIQTYDPVARRTIYWA